MYCNVEDIQNMMGENLLIQLSNATPPFSAVNEAYVEELIEESTQYIGAYLFGRISTNMTPLLKSICKDLVIYSLYKNRRPTDIPDSIFEIYKEAVKLLDRLQKGSLTEATSVLKSPTIRTKHR